MVHKIKLIITLSLFSLNLVASQAVLDQKAAEAVRKIYERSKNAREIINRKICESRLRQEGFNTKSIDHLMITTQAWLAELPKILDQYLVRSEQSVRRIQDREQVVREFVATELSKTRLQEQVLFKDLEEFQRKQFE